MNNDPIRPEDVTAPEQALDDAAQAVPPTEGTDPAKTPESKSSALRTVFDVLEMFAWSVFVVMLLFTFVIRLCRVEGHSMENTLYEDQNLLLYSFNYTPRQNDIIVFHLTKTVATPTVEKTMVKRVIATEGQKVEINFETGVVTIDGEPYDDCYAVFKDGYGFELGYYTRYAEHHYTMQTRTFSATVPEGHVFVMGDNRNNSMDSRSEAIGFVDMRCILGKVIVRIAPFTSFIEQ